MKVTGCRPTDDLRRIGSGVAAGAVDRGLMTLAEAVKHVRDDHLANVNEVVEHLERRESEGRLPMPPDVLARLALAREHRRSILAFLDAHVEDKF